MELLRNAKIVATQPVHLVKHCSKFISGLGYSYANIQIIELSHRLR